MDDIALALPPRPTRDAARTRELILRAGQRLFAQKGYTTTGVREIAAEAGVSIALVQRYFGSKEGLLRAALEELLQIDMMVDGPRDQFGARAAAMLMQSTSIGNPVAIMMLAMADLDARRLCCDLVHDNVIVPLAAWLGGADAFARAAQLNTLWTGFITTRQLMPLPQLSDDQVAPTIAWVARVTQAIADADEAA